MARRKKVDIICYKNGTAPYIDTLWGDYIQKIAGCSLHKLHSDLHTQAIVDKYIEDMTKRFGKANHFDEIVVHNDFTSSHRQYDFRGDE